MRDRSIIPTNLADWPRVAGLLPELKLILAVGFWGGRYTNSIGVASIPIRPLAASLGLDPAALECGIQTLCLKQLLVDDWDAAEFFVCDWFRFHTFKGVGVTIAKGEFAKINSASVRNAVKQAASWIDAPKDSSASPSGDVSKKQSDSLPTAAAKPIATSSAAKTRDRRKSRIVTFLPEDIARAEDIENEFAQDVIATAVSAIEKKDKEPVPGVVRKEIERQAKRESLSQKQNSSPIPGEPEAVRRNRYSENLPKVLSILRGSTLP